MPCAVPCKSPATFPLENFPKLRELALEWKTVREEFLRLDSNILPIGRGAGEKIARGHKDVFQEVISYIETHSEYGWIKGWADDGGQNDDWLQYGLSFRGMSHPIIERSMPETMKMLQSLDGITVAALNTLKPGTLLPVHTHGELKSANILQMHVVLGASNLKNLCCLNVDGEFISHTEGSAFIFDGSHIHYAFNASKMPRTILYLEFLKDAFITADS